MWSWKSKWCGCRSPAPKSAKKVTANSITTTAVLAGQLIIELDILLQFPFFHFHYTRLHSGTYTAGRSFVANLFTLLTHSFYCTPFDFILASFPLSFVTPATYCFLKPTLTMYKVSPDRTDNSHFNLHYLTNGHLCLSIIK